MTVCGFGGKGRGAGFLSGAERELLRLGLAELGGAAGVAACGDEAVLEALEWHLEKVAQENRVQNLTAITDPREMVVKHTLDSAAVLGAVTLAAGERALDVGSGAGFPGVVLQLLVPDAQVVLLDSNRKRCAFLERLAADLVARGVRGAGQLEVRWGRAEDEARLAGMRERFDLVVARAVAELRVLLEYTLPFSRLGGRVVAMKGPGGQEEVGQAGNALRVLGGEVERVHRIVLPEGAGERVLIVVRKVMATPGEYPRRPGVPARRPL